MNYTSASESKNGEEEYASLWIAFVDRYMTSLSQILTLRALNMIAKRIIVKNRKIAKDQGPPKVYTSSSSGV
jgi:hypothetical protein